MMGAIEVLSIACVNYLTTSQDLFRPTMPQLAQVRAHLTLLHQNLIKAVSTILSRLPAPHSSEVAKL
jgi:hypothetical protein